VVELPVVIDGAAAQAVRLQGGDAIERLLAGEGAGGLEAHAAGEQVVEPEPRAVEGPFPPVVTGHYEGEVAHQVRGVAQQPPALAQGLQHQRDVALLEVAYAAVHKLGAAAGGALGEVVTLHQGRAITARRRVYGRPQAGGAAAHHENIPDLPRLEEAGEHGVAVHGVVTPPPPIPSPAPPPGSSALASPPPAPAPKPARRCARLASGRRSRPCLSRRPPRGRRDRRRRGRWSPAPAAAPPARPRDRPGAASAGRWPWRRRPPAARPPARRSPPPWR